MSLAKLALDVARMSCTPEQERALEYAERLFAVLGDIVGITFAKVALAHAHVDSAPPLEALADELKAVADRHSALAGKVTIPSPSREDVLITNPTHSGCKNPFCKDCGARAANVGGAS